MMQKPSRAATEPCIWGAAPAVTWGISELVALGDGVTTQVDVTREGVAALGTTGVTPSRLEKTLGATRLD